MRSTLPHRAVLARIRERLGFLGSRGRKAQRNEGALRSLVATLQGHARGRLRAGIEGSDAMYAAIGTRVRMERATLASLGIHLVAALAIPAFAWTASSAAPIETVSFMHVIRVEIAPPRAPQPPPRAVAPHRNPTLTVNFTSHVRLVTARPHRRASPEPAIASNAPAAPAVAEVERGGLRKLRYLHLARRDALPGRSRRRERRRSQARRISSVWSRAA